MISIAALSFIFERNESFRNVAFLGLIASSTLAFLMGLFDDAYNTKVWLKLLTQILCGVILIGTGTYIQLFGNVWLNYLLTILWVIGLMNSINMLDNMDGITSIVSLFIFIAFLLLVVMEHTFTSPYTVVLIGLIAALLGFLFYNWNPSKLYMGDTGSQFLGLLLAFFGIVFLWNSRSDGMLLSSDHRIILVLTMFVLPISDTTTVVIKRLRRKKSPFVGGKDHTTHHLSYLGLSDRMVAVIFLIIASLSCILVLLVYHISPWFRLYDLLFGIFFLLVFISLFIIGNKNIPKK
jgi:UDP-GlcNAc:undecaprenyl-phosphate GlcNAc-1-phosphate transferase